MTKKFTLLGSEYQSPINARSINQIDLNKKIRTTWILNRNQTPIELDDLIKDITDYCSQHNLIVNRTDLYHLNVLGTNANYIKAFEVELNMFEDENGIFYANTTPIKMNIGWKDKVDNILGLNSKKIAHPYFHKLDRTIMPRALTTFNPLQLATLYNFPTGLDGTGQKIGIIELGGGYVLSDITSYFTYLGINVTPQITAVSVDGAVNNPSDTSGANVEVILDIEIIVALCPKAAIRVYFGPNSYQGFYNCINRAITDGCGIISISWGAAEVYWSSLTLNSYNTLFQTAANNNITVFAAAGDNGSSDGTSGLSVDFPGSSPYVVSCGGTRISTNDNTTISQEIVWNNNSTTSATGGGLSGYFSRPSYQSGVTYNLNNKRGVPDISGDADPNTGYVIYSASEGGYIIVGGTSAVSPLWSGLFGRINQSIGHNAGFIHSTIYANPSVCRDITTGNNGAYTAGTGWDPCTGNGSPNGQLILNLFTSNVSAPVASFTATPLNGISPLTVNFTDTSTNTPTSWLWDFGDSTTSTNQNPSHTYSFAGTYTVSLTATNNSGSNTKTQTNYITATASNSSVIPSVTFTGTPTTGTIPLTVVYSGTGTNSPTSWLWNFGDNTTSTSQNPTHTYSNVGSYTVSLKATNSSGSNTLIKNNYINTTQVISEPIATFSGTPLTGNSPLIVNFTATSTNSPTSWLWNFGDNTTSSSQNPSHTYSTAGNYTVTLTVTNSTGSNILVKNNYITVSGSLPPAPVANFTGNPLTGIKPLTVNFTDTSTNTPTSWSWNFGDSTTSTSQNPSRTYTNAGNYTVSLTATNGGGSNTVTKTNYISVSQPSGSPPVASFTLVPRYPRVGDEIQFTDTSTNTPTTWLWDFGDGSTSTNQNPTYAYTTRGVFGIRLTVSNSSGSSSTSLTTYVF